MGEEVCVRRWDRERGRPIALEKKSRQTKIHKELKRVNHNNHVIHNYNTEDNVL